MVLYPDVVRFADNRLDCCDLLECNGCAEAVKNTEALALATAKNGGTSGLIEADCAKDG